MRIAAKVAVMIGVVTVSVPTFSGEASSRSWIRESIRSSYCARGVLEKCKPHELPARKAPARKGKKSN